MKNSNKRWSAILVPVLSGLLAAMPVMAQPETTPPPAESVSVPVPVAESAPGSNGPTATGVDLNAIKDCDASTSQGAMDAGTNHSAAGWWVGGLASGIILGLIGTGIIWGISFASNPTPDPALAPKNVEAVCYSQGFKKEAKGKNKIGAGVGGLIGTAVFLVIYVTALAPEN